MRRCVHVLKARRPPMGWVCQFGVCAPLKKGVGKHSDRCLGRARAAGLYGVACMRVNTRGMLPACV